MNNDLISRETLKKEFRKIYHCAETAEELANTMEDAIDNAPAVELRLGRMTNGTIIPIELPPAEWKINTITGDIFCSRCKKVRRDTRKEHVYYCNHCGARMLRASEVT